MIYCNANKENGNKSGRNGHLVRGKTTLTEWVVAVVQACCPLRQAPNVHFTIGLCHT